MAGARHFLYLCRLSIEVGSLLLACPLLHHRRVFLPGGETSYQGLDLCGSSMPSCQCFPYNVAAPERLNTDCCQGLPRAGFLSSPMKQKVNSCDTSANKLACRKVFVKQSLFSLFFWDQSQSDKRNGNCLSHRFNLLLRWFCALSSSVEKHWKIFRKSHQSHKGFRPSLMATILLFSRRVTLQTVKRKR